MKAVRYIAILFAFLALPGIAQAHYSKGHHKAHKRAHKATADRHASITVTKVSVAGDATPFTFTVTGPKCKDATNVTFQLTNGQSQETVLCDSPPEKEKRFKVTETVPAGWSLASISCTSTDKDPKDAFIYDVPNGSVFVELSPSEKKSCTFTNVKLPQTPVTAPTTSPPPPGLVPPTPVNTPVSTPPRKTNKRKRCRRVRSERTGEMITVCRKKQRRPGRRPGQPVRPNFTG